MKKTDNIIVVINGDNNKVSIGENNSNLTNAITISIALCMVIAVLVVSYCCPEKLADLVRWIIGIAVGG